MDKFGKKRGVVGRDDRFLLFMAGKLFQMLVKVSKYNIFLSIASVIVNEVPFHRIIASMSLLHV